MAIIDVYLKLALSLLLVSSGVALWLYTPWSVWAAATVVAGLGVLSMGKMISYLFMGGATILVMLGYAVQPDVVGLFTVFRL
ncbi:MAG: hypothetical protein IIB31_09760 [Chloroflexi bacterium]|nr:hypothetical protein [Chloroflexota bacterium]